MGFEPCFCRGLDNLEVALRDPAFLKTNQIDAANADRVRWLRDAFRTRRETVVARNRAEAPRPFVLSSCDLAAQRLGLDAPAVILDSPLVRATCSTTTPAT